MPTQRCVALARVCADAVAIAAAFPSHGAFAAATPSPSRSPSPSPPGETGRAGVLRFSLIAQLGNQ